MHIPGDTPNQYNSREPFAAQALLRPLPKKRFNGLPIVAVAIVGVSCVGYFNYETLLAAYNQTKLALLESQPAPAIQAPVILADTKAIDHSPTDLDPHMPPANNDEPDIFPAPAQPPKPLAVLEAPQFTSTHAATFDKKTFVDMLQVGGVRKSGNRSRALINNRAYAIGEQIHPDYPVTLTAVREREIVLADNEGNTYTKLF